ncbi:MULTISPECIES: NYN domain-containing protein [unclassified Pseudoalteromonas]|uniref:NYN domain-containing protein n=1 Tax=unclassified Pseudoalteromonas TaxID=194690 RepID=UPI0006E60AF9|nr:MULTISPECIES: NYN domain-containing protein [unclassified Pseudoalteromonas]KPZ52573.1 NYN domain protein [Pseudoalteromonas sp. P1-7a]KPZ58206.1 NYN domain protein [Pseudoalteromonas sp. P1-25]
MNFTFAVLVDGENASYTDYASLLEEVEKYGTVAIKWVYADWTSVRHGNWQQILHKTASSPKQQFQYGKDSADHALVMDAIELINNNQRINGVCIVSSDGGFYSLAQRIREKGLHVMAVGNESTPERFIKACHNFVFTKNLTEPAVSKVYNDVNSLLVNSYIRCAQSNEPVYLGDLGSTLKTLDSSFDYRNYGVNSLKALIKSKCGLFEIIEEGHDRCFISMIKQSTLDCTECMVGVIRKLDKGKKFGFITSERGDFHFRVDELLGNIEEYKETSKVSFYPIKSNGVVSQGLKCPSVHKIEICN